MKVYQWSRWRELTLRSFLSLCFLLLIAFVITVTGVSHFALAQVSTSISPTTGTGNLGTTVSQAGSLYNITGGFRAGTNVFHSFGNFTIGAADTANFLNTPLNGSLPVTSNILGRVTGGNPSNIFGTIQTTGFGSANLFLMNPAGIVFGPKASLNVGGSVSFTTGDYLRLADGAQFNATPGPADAFISAAPVAAFGFLGDNPGAITVQGSQLSVLEGQGISLVGGNIEIKAAALEDGTSQPTRILASSGQINLASVASLGEVLYPGIEHGPNINGLSVTNMGSITLSEGSTVDASGDAAGTIKIRGGQFVIADGTLSADTANTNGAPIAIDISVTGDLSITDTRGVPAITARTTGPGNAGEIQLNSDNLMAKSSFVDPDFLPTTLIDSHTSGDGRSGDIRITTGNLEIAGLGGSTTFTFIDSGTMSNGRGGNITINAESVNFDLTTVSTGQLLAGALVPDMTTVNGSAGNLTITADAVQVKDAILDTSAFGGPSELQKGGDIIINARDVSLSGVQVGSTGTYGGGAFTIRADTFLQDTTSFETSTISGPGGGITVEARIVDLTNGSAMISSTLGEGNAGNIRITATDHVSLLGDVGTSLFADSQPSGLFSNSFGRIFGQFGGPGNAGDIIVATSRLEMNGGRINTVTSSSGRGGNVTLNVSDRITISGEFPSSVEIVPSIFDIGPLAPSGVVTQTIGNEFCIGGLCGNAGQVSINTGALTLGNGGQINSGTSSTGRGGDIAINARDNISISGAFSDGSPVGIFSRSVGAVADSGEGGNVTLTAGQSVSLSNGAAISASSTGPANAGNIAINAGVQFLSQNAAVTTEASQASGGNILVQATDSIRLINSHLSTSVQGGPNTSSGNITLDPAIVTLQNSQVLAQASQGAGGNISIIAGTFLADQTSLVSASSQFGLSGSVNIQSPLSNLSGTLATLPQRPLQPQNLLRQRCAAQVNGQLSSLVVSGRDALPAEPGGWLMSPLALGPGDEQPPQVHAAAKPGVDPLRYSQVRPAQLLDQQNLSSQRGVWDRETGCGS
jgi:filamentous hemagglutinin family protein